MKTIIIDDERLARRHLRSLLDKQADIEIIGEASHAEEARTRLAQTPADLLFVDIQMPGESGFELLESLTYVPMVIFTTAYDQHALRAFDFNTLDYLLKPIDPERLQSALERLPKRREPQPQQPAATPGPLGLEDRVFVKDGERCWFVKLEAIRYMTSEGNHTRVYFEREKPLIHRSLQHLELRLDSQHFFRASRQHIFNLRWVERMETLPNGQLLAYLTCGAAIPLSRRQAARFRTLTSL